MKYEIIYTEDYALIVSDEDYGINDIILANDLSALAKVLETKNAHILAESIPHKTELGIMYHQSNDWKKVIAHRPLKDAPILQSVPLLPEFSQEDVDQLALEEHKFNHKTIDEISFKLGFKVGYNKAKETYKYTKEDVLRLISNVSVHLSAHPTENYNEILKICLENFQSLQQPKRPEYFECKMTQLSSNESFGLDYGSSNLKPKTITNSQGRIEWVGQYIY